MAENRSILITGARKGIGRGMAEYYTSKGFQVFGCSRGKSDLKNDRYTHFEVDVSNESAVKGMFLEIGEPVDVLLNNAGIASMNHSLLTPGETAKNILETNVLGTFLCSREAAKGMMTRKKGRIVNFSTFAVPFKLEGEAIYAASKAAVESLTEILSREFAPIGISVNAVAPPAMQTDLTLGVKKETMDGLLKRQSVHRYGTVEELLRVVDFFIDPANDMVTGQVVYMGGV